MRVAYHDDRRRYLCVDCDPSTGSRTRRSTQKLSLRFPAHFRGDSARIAHRDAQSARRQSQVARRPVDSRRRFSDRTLYRSASRARARSLWLLWKRQKQCGTQLWRLFLLCAGKGHRFAVALQGERFLENGFSRGTAQHLSKESNPDARIRFDSI